MTCPPQTKMATCRVASSTPQRLHHKLWHTPTVTDPHGVGPSAPSEGPPQTWMAWSTKESAKGSIRSQRPQGERVMSQA